MVSGPFTGLTLADIAGQLRRGDTDPVDLLARTLAAIQAAQPALNAFVTVDVDGATAAARHAAGELAAGLDRGLLHGVPVAVAGASEDKPEVATRVAASGAGINLKTGTPTAEQVRSAVRTLLDDRRYRERARALAAEYARYDAVSTAVATVESLQANHR